VAGRKASTCGLQTGFFDAGTDAEDQCFVGQGDWGADGQAEGAEICYRGDTAAGVFIGEVAMAGSFHEVVVFFDQLRQWFLIHLADDRDHHTVFDLDCDADIQRSGVYHFVANEVSCGGGVF